MGSGIIRKGNNTPQYTLAADIMSHIKVHTIIDTHAHTDTHRCVTCTLAQKTTASLYIMHMFCTSVLYLSVKCPECRGSEQFSPHVFMPGPFHNNSVKGVMFFRSLTESSRLICSWNQKLSLAIKTTNKAKWLLLLCPTVTKSTTSTSKAH